CAPEGSALARRPAEGPAAEQPVGEAYWRARAAARHAPRNDALRRTYEGAWTTLATRAGAYRAGFVARATRPRNPEAPPDALVFGPPVPPDGPPVPRADVLPDRFVVLGFFIDPTTHALSEIARGVGAAIPDDL